MKASANSITTADGQTFNVDVIVCATGFDVSLRPQWNMVGRSNMDLRKEWEIDPESYVSPLLLKIMVSGTHTNTGPTPLDLRFPG